jgi:hypothetical protein
MTDKTESIHVTMHVISRKNARDLGNDSEIHGKVEAVMNKLMEPIRNGRQLANRLCLPANVPIEWDVRVAAVLDGFRAPHDQVPVMLSVGGVPSIMEKLLPDVAEEMTNLIFNEIRKETTDTRELAAMLGYESQKPAKFQLCLPQHLKSRSPAAMYGDGDGDGGGNTGGDFGDFGGGGGWAKGCNNWPW